MDKNSINQKLNEISEIRNKLTFDIGQIELQKVDIETKKENMLFLEGSAFTGKQIELVFTQLAEAIFKKYVEGKRVWDVFCNQGGFALAAAKAGAAEVTAVNYKNLCRGMKL